MTENHCQYLVIVALVCDVDKMFQIKCFLIKCFRRSGAAVTLVTRENWRMAPELIPILERAGQVSISA